MENLSSAPEAGDEAIRSIQRYLDVIATSNDADEVLSVDQLAHNIFQTDPPGTKSWELETTEVAYEIRCAKPDAIWSRVHAVQHVVRGMIQGSNNFPKEQFGQVIDISIDAILKIDPSFTPKDARSFLRHEISEVWEPFQAQERDEYDRASTAYELVSSPARYRLMKLGMGIVNRFAHSSTANAILVPEAESQNPLEELDVKKI